MKRKFHIAVPVSVLIVAALVIGYFTVTDLHIGSSSGSASASAPEAVMVEELGGKNINAPVAAAQTLAPKEAVSESDYNFESYYEPVDSTAEPEEEKESPYKLSDYERMVVECAVMFEAGRDKPEAQMMIAQCILDGSLRNGCSVSQTISSCQINSVAYDKVSDEVKESVSRVFDDAERITEDMADIWYNPGLFESSWHEAQEYVITVGNFRFFWANENA